MCVDDRMVANDCAPFSVTLFSRKVREIRFLIANTASINEFTPLSLHSGSSNIRVFKDLEPSRVSRHNSEMVSSPP